MKTSFLSFLVRGLAAAALVSAPALLLAQNNPPTARPMSPELESYTLAKLVDKPVQASNQEQLSILKDFLIHPPTGRVAFAVVDSGSNTFRLVPTSAFDVNHTANAIVLRLDRNQWDKVGTLTEGELKGRISLNAEHQQRLAQQFGLREALNAEGFDALMRATSLRGQALRAGNDSVGTIEDVAIDLARQTSAAIVKANAAFAGSEQRFLLRFDQLQSDDQGFTTTLTRAAFQPVPAGAFGPTGYANAGAPFTTAPISSAATAVQQALARAGANRTVEVVPENRIVLRGSVENEQKKNEIEAAARQAAPGTRIDSELTVRRW